MSDDAGTEADLLVLLLDINALNRQFQQEAVHQLDHADVVAQVLAFSNAHAMFNKQNQLAVYVMQAHSSELVHLSLGEDGAATGAGGAGGAGGLGLSVFPSTALHQGLTRIAAASSAEAAPVSTGVALSGALSRALCLTQRLSRSPARMRASTRSKARILALLASPDVPMQYIPVMNAIFSAQRADTVIDAVVLSPKDSSFLQQATHLTGGLYFKPADASRLLQTLLNHLLPDTATRGMLTVIQTQGVDFRASCFCHKTTIDVGYVCSVCLSIFCKPLRVCSTCSTHFGQVRNPGGAK